MHLGATDLDVMARQEIEAKIVCSTVATLLAAGYSIDVMQGCDETVLRDWRVYQHIIDKLMECDEDVIVVKRGDRKNSFVHFVYGNDGYDVISDHGVTLVHDLQPVLDYADTYRGWRQWSTGKKVALVTDFEARKQAQEALHPKKEG